MVAGRDSFELLRRNVQERHKAVKNITANLLNLYAYGQNDQILKSSKQLLSALEALQATIATTDRPNWLNTLSNTTRNYVSNSQDANTCLNQFKTLTSSFTAIQNHCWVFGAGAANPLTEFDDIVAQFVAESRIEELVAKLIDTLNKILAAGVVDSRSVNDALETLLATLTASRDKSFYAQVMSFRFVRSFGKNLSKEYLKKIDILSPLVEAWDKSVDELNGEYDSVQLQLRDWSDDLIEDWSKDLKQRYLGKPPAQLPAPSADDAVDT